jgi:hypothetical protein
MVIGGEGTARRYIGLDIEDALRDIGDVRNLLPPAHLKCEGELLGHLAEAEAALQKARITLNTEEATP